ncbi:hypothetical protein [Methylohalobius crimeensis]|uniref:hypothetical protein n=1 Tax=Methylohalobius crimeensis TaxID=244365 RepID=UPI0003B57065|nr:hypothetical protein [Methylohalobius crimeensis]
MPCNHRKALDLAKAGDWDTAHKMVQPHSDKQSCLIHGYLHRVEGDLSNARYWYRRAGDTMPDNTLDAELNRLYTLIREDQPR